jgi:hypothetical protein
MKSSQRNVFSANRVRKVPSAFAVLKVNFSFFLGKKALRLKVYSLGTGTQGRGAYQSQQGMMLNDARKNNTI